MAPTPAHGKICYIEIPATDINRSANFYKEIFGWNIRQHGDGSIAFDDTTGEVSGTWVLGRPAATQPGLLVSIMVDSVAQSADAIIAEGGEIVQQTGADGAEVIARFRDPAGNVFCLYEDASANGKICYIEIPATNIQRSAEFYNTAFGWNIRQDNDGNCAFDDSNGQVSGMWVLGWPPATQPGPLIYIMVDSVAETATAITEIGGEIVQPIGVDAPEITARFRDPAGNILGLYQEPGGSA